MKAFSLALLTHEKSLRCDMSSVECIKPVEPCDIEIY